MSDFDCKVEIKKSESMIVISRLHGWNPVDKDHIIMKNDNSNDQ